MQCYASHTYVWFTMRREKAGGRRERIILRNGSVVPCCSNIVWSWCNIQKYLRYKQRRFHTCALMCIMCAQVNLYRNHVAYGAQGNIFDTDVFVRFQEFSKTNSSKQAGGVKSFAPITVGKTVNSYSYRAHL